MKYVENYRQFLLNFTFNIYHGITEQGGFVPFDRIPDASRAVDDGDAGTSRSVAIDLYDPLLRLGAIDGVYIVVEDIPPGVRFSAGRFNGDDTWSLGPGEIDGLRTILPSHLDAPFTLTVRVLTPDPCGYDYASTTAKFDVVVTPDSGSSAVAGVTASAHRVAILERLGNADNVGAVFRSAAALGFDGVLLGPACADPLYRKAIRTSMGAALSLPFADAEPWPDVLRSLERDGWMVTALVTAPGARPLRDLRAQAAGRRVAVVIGHEGEGLSDGARDACAFRARIPMAAGVDSLNAAIAASIAFYELGGDGTRDPGSGIRDPGSGHMTEGC